MLAKTKKQLEVSFEKEVRADFDKIKSLKPDHQVIATYKIISNLIKASIGKSHEYTIEESLFILNEEHNISEDIYNKLKKILLHFSYFKYASHDKQIEEQTLEKFEAEIMTMIPSLITDKNEIEALKIYEEEKSKKTFVPEDNKLHLQLREHKKDLINAEREILKEIDSELNPKSPKEQIQDEIKNEESDKTNEFEFENTTPEEETKIEEEKDIPEEENEIVKDGPKQEEDSYHFKNTYIQSNYSKGESNKSDIDRLLDDAPSFMPNLHLPEDDFTDLTKIKISFKDLFENTTEFPLEEVINYEFDNDKVKTKGWDLHIKYHLLKGNTTQHIKNHYQDKINNEALNEIIKNNSNYISKTQKYTYLKTIQEIIIIMTLSVIFGRNLGKEANKLTKSGFSKSEVNFVLEHILESF